MDDEPSSGAVRAVPGKTDQPSIETRITDFVRFGVIALFAYWSFTLVAPFIILIVWAAILVVGLYPLYAIMRRWLGGRGRLAAFLLTLICLTIIVGPLAAIAMNMVDAAQFLLSTLGTGRITVPLPAESVRDWPLIGERVYAAWALAAANLKETLARLEPSLLRTGGVVVAKVASAGVDLLGFVVSVIIAGFLFGPAPRLGEGVKQFAHRIAGERGVDFVSLAAATIRNVARGVIGVALIQALLAGLVFNFFNIPGPGALAFLVMVFCIIQIGPALVLLPVIIWAWMSMETLTALAFTVLLLPLLAIDNIMKPILVARGLSTPMLVILMGVIGGTLSYGLIGLFLGPIVLSVFYELVIAWVKSPSSATASSDR